MQLLNGGGFAFFRVIKKLYPVEALVSQATDKVLQLSLKIWAAWPLSCLLSVTDGYGRQMFELGKDRSTCRHVTPCKQHRLFKSRLKGEGDEHNFYFCRLKFRSFTMYKDAFKENNTISYLSQLLYQVFFKRITIQNLLWNAIQQKRNEAVFSLHH